MTELEVFRVVHHAHATTADFAQYAVMGKSAVADVVEQANGQTTLVGVTSGTLAETVQHGKGWQDRQFAELVGLA